MQNLVSVILFFGTGFVVAMSAAWLLVKLTHYLRNKLNPAPGAILRIRAASGVYRSHMVQLGNSVWTISAPLQRDSHVPLRIGEEVVIEAATNQGALLFRSKILARETDPHTIIIQRPSRVHRVDRRDHKRWPHLAGAPVKVEGQSASVLDLSEGGVRVDTTHRFHKGDRVRIDMPWARGVYAWVLSADDDGTRLRFEELMELRSPKSETAPAV